MTNFSEQVLRIKKKLIEAKEADKHLKVFGAESHRYEIGKPATQEEVEKFENKYSVKLPECYKTFVLEIGNGGKSYQNSAAGPFYGIYPLGENVDDLIYENADKLLKQICLIYPKMSDEYWKSLNKNIDENENISDEEYEKELGKIYSGILPIGSQGCTYLHGIVLNGEHRGRVLNLDLERHKPHFTYENNFLDWYERWLDEVISGQLIDENPSWFGYTMGGSDRDILQKYLSFDDPKEKEECLNGLLSKHKIQTESVQLIENQFLESSGELKTKFLQILCKFNYEKAKPHLIKLAETELLPVFQFIFWYAKDKSLEWLPIIKENIDKIEDDETFRLCTYLLKETQNNYADLIIPFTKHKDENIRVTAFYNLGLFENKKDFINLFINGLNDTSNRVIHTTLQSLSKVKDNRLLEHYKRLAIRFPVEQDYILVNLNHRLKEYGLDNLTIQQTDLNKFEIQEKPQTKKWYQIWK